MSAVDLAGGALLELGGLAFLVSGLRASCFPDVGFGSSGLSCGTGWLFVILGLMMIFVGLGLQVIMPSESDEEFEEAFDEG